MAYIRDVIAEFKEAWQRHKESSAASANRVEKLADALMGFRVAIAATSNEFDEIAGIDYVNINAHGSE